MRTNTGKKLYCKQCPFWKRCKRVDLAEAPKWYCVVEDVNRSWVVVRCYDGGVLTFKVRVLPGGLSSSAGNEDVTIPKR